MSESGTQVPEVPWDPLGDATLGDHITATDFGGDALSGEVVRVDRKQDGFSVSVELDEPYTADDLDVERIVIDTHYNATLDTWTSPAVKPLDDEGGRLFTLYLAESIDLQ